MPTNLPPEYFEADRKYREAKSPQEKTEALEVLLSTIPKHKGTDKLRAELRKKLSKLKSQSQSKKKTPRHESSFHIEKEGAGRVIVLGAANVGKSSIVGTLTNAAPEVSESPYTTWVPKPGMMTFENIQIQLIDTPPIDRDYIEPELLDLIKNSDLILLLVDIKAFPIEQFQIAVEMLVNNKIIPLHLKEKYSGLNALFIPTIAAVNKVDVEELDEECNVLCELLREEGWSLLPISVRTGRNLNQLMKNIFREMKLIRVYSKPPGKEADLTKPFVLKEGGTVEQFAYKVHHDFYEKLKTARIWGKNVFDGQRVGRDHVLLDGNIVELHI